MAQFHYSFTNSYNFILAFKKPQIIYKKKKSLKARFFWALIICQRFKNIFSFEEKQHTLNTTQAHLKGDQGTNDKVPNIYGFKLS